MTQLWLSLIFGLSCKKAPLIDSLYRLPEPSSNWMQVDPGSADRAWLQLDNHAVIYVDVNCKGKFSDRSLEDSMLSLFWGIKVGDVLVQEKLEIDRRAALYQVVNAEIDGVRAHIGGIVISKNACLYDFLLISEPSTYDDNSIEFLKIATGLRTVHSNLKMEQ